MNYFGRTRTNQHFEQLCSNEYLSGIHYVSHQLPAEPVLDLVADSVGDKVLKLVEVDVVDEVVGEEGQAEVPPGTVQALDFILQG